MPLSYEDWMEAVDQQVLFLTGGECSEEDLPDWDSRELYDEGVSPKGAAKHAIKEAGGF